MSVSSDEVFVIVVLGKTVKVLVLVRYDIKISALRSLADIFFLHVLHFVFLVCYTIRYFSYAIRVNCMSYI